MNLNIVNDNNTKLIWKDILQIVQLPGNFLLSFHTGCPNEYLLPPLQVSNINVLTKIKEPVDFNIEVDKFL